MKIIIRSILAFSFLCISISSILPKVHAENYIKYFNIISPEDDKKISFVSEDPSFSINAPEGWYMAKINADIPIKEKAFFCKIDPTASVKKGDISKFELPYIKISFMPNIEQRSAKEFTNEFLGLLNFISKATSLGKFFRRGKDVRVLSHERYVVDTKMGSHLKLFLPRKKIMVDSYVFTMKDERLFILVEVNYKSTDLEDIEAIKKAVSSIIFKK